MTDNTGLIQILRNNRFYEAADALEQAQTLAAQREARIAELEAECDRLRTGFLQECESIRVGANELVVPLAAQLVQMRDALDSCGTSPLDGNDNYNRFLVEKALALSTAHASEILAAHDAKVIERCAAHIERFGKGYGGDFAGAIRALIAAPKPGESKEVG